GRADDLLTSKVAADLIAAVEAGDDRADADGDQHDAGGDAAVTEQLAHLLFSFGLRWLRRRVAFQSQSSPAASGIQRGLVAEFPQSPGAVYGLVRTRDQGESAHER